MKKNINFLAIAAVASLTVAACNNNSTETTDTIDSTPIEQVAEEIIAEPAEVLDTTPVVVEEATKAAKQTVKKAAKQATKEVVNTTVNENEVPAAAKKEVDTKVQNTGKNTMKPKF